MGGRENWEGVESRKSSRQMKSIQKDWEAHWKTNGKGCICWNTKCEQWSKAGMGSRARSYKASLAIQWKQLKGSEEGG